MAERASSPTRRPGMGERPASSARGATTMLLMNRRIAPLAAAAFLSAAAVAFAQDSRPVDEIWTGYVFKDAAGRVRIGRPVIAMGVMATGARVVQEPLATKLKPLVFDAMDDWHFVNYALDAPSSRPADAMPRAFVSLRGRVASAAPDADDARAASFPPRRDEVMRDASIVEIEWIPPRWVEAYAFVFVDRRSPFRIDLDRGAPKEEELAAFAPDLVKALAKMYAVPKAPKEDVERTRAIDPKAATTARWRSAQERNLHRWLVDAAGRYALDLPELKAFPPLPPSSTEVQGIFLKAATRAAFLKDAAIAWAGALEDLELWHYVEAAGSTWYETVDVATIRDRWSDADYVARRDATARVLKR
jgi:hypothetical protein